MAILRVTINSNRYFDHRKHSAPMSSSLCVMKFGGTSVGDADCIRRTAAIVHSAATERPVAVVVSAMSGVTNRLIKAAKQAESGEQDFVTLAPELRVQHLAALDTLVRDPQKRAPIAA